MTKDEHYNKAKGLLEKHPDKGRSYIRGSLAVQRTGELSDKLRALLHDSKKKTISKLRKKKSSSAKVKSRSAKNVGNIS